MTAPEGEYFPPGEEEAHGRQDSSPGGPDCEEFARRKTATFEAFATFKTFAGTPTTYSVRCLSSGKSTLGNELLASYSQLPTFGEYKFLPAFVVLVLWSIPEKGQCFGSVHRQTQQYLWLEESTFMILGIISSAELHLLEYCQWVDWRPGTGGDAQRWRYQ
jgi:hypothetical protein